MGLQHFDKYIAYLKKVVYDNNNLFLSFCICKVFIITNYDNNVIIIFDDSKFIHYPFSFRYSSNNVITTISFLELYSYYQN